MFKISDLTLSEKVLEKQYSVVQVSEWTERNGDELVKKGWKYEVVLPKLRFEKFSIKVESQYPVVTQEELEEKGSITVLFDNLVIKPYATANNGFVSIGISAIAKNAKLVENRF